MRISELKQYYLEYYKEMDVDGYRHLEFSNKANGNLVIVTIRMRNT